MKKITVLFLIICVLFTSACATNSGKGHDKVLDIAQLSDNSMQLRYSFEFTDFPMNLWFSPSNIASIDSRIFILGSFMDSSYLYCLGQDGMNPTLLALCEDGTEQWYAYCSMGDKLYILDAISNQIIEFGVDGKKLRCIDIPDDIFVNDIVSNGEYIFTLGDGVITAMIPDDENTARQVFSIKVSPSASMAGSSNGKVFVAWKDGEVQALSEIDTEGQRLHETVYLSSDCALAGAGRDWEIYLRIGGALYGYKPSEGVMRKLLSFTELGLKNNGTVHELEGNRLLYTGGFGDVASVPLILEPEGDADERVTLVLATIGELPYGMGKAVLAWNQLHPECSIEIRDYSEHSGNQGVRAAEYQLIADIGSGKGPDLYSLSEPIAGRLLRQGLLEDLYPYIDNDPEVSRNDFMSGPLSALEVNGTLPHIAPGFSLLTSIAAKKDVGGMPDFSYESLYQLVNTSPYYQSVFDMGYSKDQWLRIMVASSGKRLVDWSEAECSFDSEYFKNLLTLSASRTEQAPFSGGDISDIIESSHSILYMLVLDNVWQAAIADDTYGTDNYVYVGIPEVGNVVAPEFDIGMAIQSPNKEKCWQFIRELLLSGSSYITEIPLRRDGVKQQMINELDAMKEYIAEHPGREKAMEHLIAVIEDTEVLYQHDAELWNIIQTEANKFYSGQNTLDKTVQAIQSRASLYLSEQS